MAKKPFAPASEIEPLEIIVDRLSFEKVESPQEKGRELLDLYRELSRLPQTILEVIRHRSGDITLVEPGKPFWGFDINHIEQLRDRVRELDVKPGDI